MFRDLATRQFSLTCPRSGSQHSSNRESEVVFHCKTCGLYVHAEPEGGATTDF